jgi:phage terminase small subunit
MSLVEIAKKINKPASTVRRWKSTQEWDRNKSERSVSKANVRKQKAVAKEIEKVVEEQLDLTDKQRLFCCHYIRCFNATKAYMKTYDVSYPVAAAAASRLMKQEKIQRAIIELKQNRMNIEMLSEEDIFQKYMDIAFSDITDYASFGTRTVTDDETGEEYNISFVNLKDSDQVDGTLISEVSHGKNGTKVKLLDQLKALQWLTDHMDMATAEQKARIAQVKAQTDKITGKLDDKNKKEKVVIINDVGS